MEKRRAIRVQGRVQGVFFRASTAEVARRLGLRGWVKNCPDGSVAIEAEGAADRLDELVAWCGEGPPMARVRSVEVSRLDATEADTGFVIAV